MRQQMARNRLGRSKSTRLGVGLSSQFLNMASNSVMLFALAHYNDDEQFGRASLVYGVVIIGIGVTKAMTADLVSARHGGSESAVDSVTTREAKSAIVLGVATAGVAAVVATAVDAGLAGYVIAGAAIPIAAHEFSRQTAFASYRPIRALALDTIWVLTGIAFWVLGTTLGTNESTVVVSAWCAGAIASAFVSATQNRSNRVQSGKGLAETISTRLQYGLEFLLSRGIPEVVAWSLAIAGTFALAGQFRLAQVLLGPLSVVIGGARSLLVAELRPLASRAVLLRKSSRLASLGLSVLPVLYLAVLLVFAHPVASLLLGDLDSNVLSIAAILAVRRAFSAASIPPFLLLRVLDQSRITTTLRLAEAMTAGLMISILGLFAGSTGSLSGYVISGGFALILWWVFALRATATDAVRLSGDVAPHANGGRR